MQSSAKLTFAVDFTSPISAAGQLACHSACSRCLLAGTVARPTRILGLLIPCDLTRDCA
jgi:hypothetical protein